MGWKIIDHTADVGLEVEAPSWEELFAQVAEGFYALCLGGAPSLPPEGPAGRARVLRLEALDLEELVVSWINELIFILESEGAIFFPATLTVTTALPAFVAPPALPALPAPPALVAEGHLGPFPGGRIAVKAATYGGMVLESFPHPFLRLYLDL
jgi:hypothetical protein